jgi:hypothetical protein
VRGKNQLALYTSVKYFVKPTFRLRGIRLFSTGVFQAMKRIMAGEQRFQELGWMEGV